MASAGGKAIDSIKALQRRVPAILREVNADQDLARAALANPILAIEALGYEIDPQLRAEVERRVRFDEKQANRLGQLHRRVERIVGHPVDIDSDDAVERVLFRELKLRRPSRRRAKEQAAPAEHATPSGELLDRLDRLEDEAHPVIEPLRAYRRLTAGTPRLASREAFDAIRGGTRTGPVRTTAVTFRRRRSRRS